MRYEIYLLQDNTDIGYVGQTERGHRIRWRQYKSGPLSRVKAGPPGRYTPASLPDLRRHWMDYLTAAGRFDEISMEVIAHTASKTEALALEEKRIAYYLAQGYILVNTIHNPYGQALNQQLKEAWIAGRHDATVLLSTMYGGRRLGRPGRRRKQHALSAA